MSHKVMRLGMKYHKVMRLEMKCHKPLTTSTVLVVQQRAGRRSVFTMKVIYQWGSHVPVIQAVLFHCMSSVADDLHMDR